MKRVAAVIVLVVARLPLAFAQEAAPAPETQPPAPSAEPSGAPKALVLPGPAPAMPCDVQTVCATHCGALKIDGTTPPPADASKLRPPHDVVLVPLGATTNPDDAPTTPAVLAAAFGASKDGATVRISAKPFRPFNARPLWGVEFTGATTTDKNTTTLGIAYRVDPRWIAEKTYAAEKEDLGCGACRELFAEPEWRAKACSGNRNDTSFMDEVDDRKKQVAASNGLLRRLPVLSIGGEIGFLPIDPKVADQRTLSRLALLPKVFWRHSYWLEVSATASYSNDINTNSTSDRHARHVGTSGSVMFVIPELVGAKREELAESLFQRGIGIGPMAVYRRCLEDGADRQWCRNIGSKLADGQIVEDFLVGGMLDLRLKRELVPRITLGRHLYKSWINNAELKSYGFEVSAQVGVVGF